ncbi:MAG: YceI family protein [Rickettsiales bacterium]|nr:YceI family protein [Rickettsiales bacterium]
MNETATRDTSSSEVTRYASAVIIMHWLMAAGIFMMLGSGLVMTYLELEQSFAFKLYQWHKGGGVLILLALAIRIFMRLVSTSPKLPASFPKLEQIAAKLDHIGLYVVMIVMVASGWVMVSSSPYGLPTLVFGWFEWPHIPGLAANKLIEGLAKDTHFFAAIGIGLLLAGHIAAVIKHRMVDHENLLTRMWWSTRSMWWLVPMVLIPFLIIVFAQGTPVSNTPQVALQESDIQDAKEPLVADHSDVTEAKTESQVALDQHRFIVDYPASYVRFTGTHAGNQFEGAFSEWQADIHFNPDGLDESHINATFITKTALTGNSLYDGTLPQEDWLNVTAYPEALFRSTQITYLQDNNYRIEGDLTIRNVTHPISFEAQISDLIVMPVQVDATFAIDRIRFEMGLASDKNADWVSKDITISLRLKAQRG